jgi:hypothetical protein
MNVSLSYIRWRRGLGRGGAQVLTKPLSLALSPFVPHGEKKTEPECFKSECLPTTEV